MTVTGELPALRGRLYESYASQHSGLGSGGAERGVVTVEVADRGNAHELMVDGVPQSKCTPVSIGDHVWVGSGVTVLGAEIGDGAVVGAGSVVVSAVPSRSPWREIRRALSEKMFPSIGYPCLVPHSPHVMTHLDWIPGSD